MKRALPLSLAVFVTALLTITLALVFSEQSPTLLPLEPLPAQAMPAQAVLEQTLPIQNTPEDGTSLAYIHFSLDFADDDTTQEEYEAITPYTGAEIDPSRPMVALTFDDGPSIYTSIILDLLEYHGGRATFCILGYLAEENKGIILRAFNMGSEVIGHSWDHEDFTRISGPGIKAQITQTSDVIEYITGVRPSLYRPPFGAVNSTVVNASKELGYAIITWSVDSRDWYSRNADAIYTAIMSTVENGSIVLSHDLHRSTASAMAMVIPELIERGYQLVTVSELFQHKSVVPQAGVVYRTPTLTR